MKLTITDWLILTIIILGVIVIGRTALQAAPDQKSKSINLELYAEGPAGLQQEIIKDPTIYDKRGRVTGYITRIQKIETVNHLKTSWKLNAVMKGIKDIERPFYVTTESKPLITGSKLTITTKQAFMTATILSIDE